jgi:hypothetical protein
VSTKWTELRNEKGGSENRSQVFRSNRHMGTWLRWASELFSCVGLRGAGSRGGSAHCSVYCSFWGTEDDQERGLLRTYPMKTKNVTGLLSVDAKLMLRGQKVNGSTSRFKPGRRQMLRDDRPSDAIRRVDQADRVTRPLIPLTAHHEISALRARLILLAQAGAKKVAITVIYDQTLARSHAHLGRHLMHSNGC